MITPLFKCIINLVFYIIHNFFALTQNFRLSFCSYKRTDRPFNSSCKCLHQIAVTYKNKCHSFYSFLFGILYRVEQHAFKIHISLVYSNSLEFELHRTVLHGYFFHHLLEYWDLHVQARPGCTLVFAKHGNYTNVSLVYCKK